MKFGICCGPGSFAPQIAGESHTSLAPLIETMQRAGADYVEFPVGAVAVEGDLQQWTALRSAMQDSPLQVEAFNSFIPAHHRITGDGVDLPRVLGYCEIALERCKELGGEVVVLGSAGARKVTPGFAAARAEEQFVEFCEALAPIAEKTEIDIAIEPLNSREDNLILSVEHGARLVRQIDRPRIRLLADLYHMSEEREPVEHVAAAGALLRHTHVADLGRVAPGYAEGGEEDFLGFFRNLRVAGYGARCSFEGSFANIAEQAAPTISLLRRRWQESAG